MARFFLLSLTMALLSGCLVERVPQFAPRRTPTAEHLAAVSTGDCRSCHDVKEQRKHSVKDNCFDCHKICRECPQ